jgi:hypothetical protein
MQAGAADYIRNHSTWVTLSLPSKSPDQQCWGGYLALLNLVTCITKISPALSTSSRWAVLRGCPLRDKHIR